MTIIYKLISFAINLQLFADAGTLVNATTTYVKGRVHLAGRIGYIYP